MGVVVAPVSLRLDQETRRRVERIARRKKVPPSQVLREAVMRWIDDEAEGISPYDSIQDLIGVARGASRRFPRIQAAVSLNYFGLAASMVLIDAGPLIAIVRTDDQRHAVCVAALRKIRQPMATVWPG